MWSTGYSVCWPCGSASTASRVTSGSGNGEFRAVGRLDTLLGPEGTGASSGDLGLRDQDRITFGWCGFGGPGCFLRTAQWTRASLVDDESRLKGSLFVGCLRVVFVVYLRFVLIVLCVQVFKGIRWMPWHQEPMKDVGACDMPRGVGNQTLIRGFPNGETWHPSWGVAAC